MAYHDLSIKCSNSAALSRPKKTLLISLPKSITSTKACKYITAMLKRKQKLPVKKLIFPIVYNESIQFKSDDDNDDEDEN